MPYRNRHIALALILLLVGVPVEASSPWGWLQKLSGPGPFERRLPGFDVPYWGITPRCPNSAPQTLDDKLLAPAFTISQYKSDADDRFDRTDLTTYSAILYLHPAGFLHRAELCSNKTPHTSPLNALDIGAGIAWYHFAGDATSSIGTSTGQPATASGPFTRTAMPLRFKITPSELFSGKLHGTTRKVLAMFSYNINVDLFVGSFDQGDFNYKGPGVYHADDKALWSGGIVVDVSSLFFR